MEGAVWDEDDLVRGLLFLLMMMLEMQSKWGAANLEMMMRSVSSSSLNSDVLRDALGISTQQLPPYIYQMRVLGYPPGHLENAKQSTSGLTMFDKHGQGEMISLKFIP